VNSEHMGSPKRLPRDLAISQNLYPGSLFRSLCSGPVGARRACYVYIEERTEGAGWLVLGAYLSQSAVRAENEAFDVAIIDRWPSCDIRLSWQFP
jgi:hypothetical protein